MMKRAAMALALVLLVVSPLQSWARDCADDAATSGVARTIAIDPSDGMRLGKLQYGQTVPLRDKEVVLTFDDGPLPAYTQPILDTLDRHCIKATFFIVGKMAWAQPALIKNIAKRGHTVAVHTWSHPRALSQMPVDAAKLEIEKGFAGVSNAMGAPISPFFRYPGFNDSPELNAYLISRGISIWSVDVVCGDTEPNMTQEKLVAQAMTRLHAHGRGVLLFHDIKKVTADSLDEIIVRLKLEGYKFVHVVSNTAFIPDPEVVAKIELKPAVRNVAFTGQQPAETARPVGHSSMAGTSHVDYAHTERIKVVNGRKPAGPAANPPAAKPGAPGLRGASLNAGETAAGRDVLLSAAQKDAKAKQKP
jgi:peptidoglycan/xylan/chitin deacetylase (PgdA/CDA1 family)